MYQYTRVPQSTGGDNGSAMVEDPHLTCIRPCSSFHTRQLSRSTRCLTRSGHLSPLTLSAPCVADGWRLDRPRWPASVTLTRQPHTLSLSLTRSKLLPRCLQCHAHDERPHRPPALLQPASLDSVKFFACSPSASPRNCEFAVAIA